MTNFTFDIDDIYRNETIQGYDIHNEHLNYKKWSCDDQFEQELLGCVHIFFFICVRWG